jgi:hypothetical protein
VDRGVNVILSQPVRGIVVWSARTTSADRNWKYVNIRRLLIYPEASINRGLQWVVFEPDGTLLWETGRGRFRIPAARLAIRRADRPDPGGGLATPTCTSRTSNVPRRTSVPPRTAHCRAYNNALYESKSTHSGSLLRELSDGGTRPVHDAKRGGP